MAEDAAGRPEDELAFPMKAAGSFQRGKNRCQDWVGEGQAYPPASGRYHVFVNYTCGWCHQVLLVRALKGLEDCISVSHTQLNSGPPKGWLIRRDPTGNGFGSAFDVYNSGGVDYGSNQLTVPILFDKQTRRVVSNDPAHIQIMLNRVFNAWAKNPGLDLYPAGEKREEIEKMNAVLFPGLNDGVYRCAFSRTDAMYKEAFDGLLGALAHLDRTLATGGPFLCGEKPTLADTRAFPHLFRFDNCYRHMMLRPDPADKNPKLPLRVVEYLRRVFDTLPGVREVCDPHLALVGYFGGIGRSTRGETTLAERAKHYEENRYDWMPSLPELEAKREKEGLPREVEGHLGAGRL